MKELQNVDLRHSEERFFATKNLMHKILRFAQNDVKILFRNSFLKVDVCYGISTNFIDSFSFGHSA